MASKRGGCPRQRTVVKYNGAIIRRPDIEIFEGPFFLNDRIIDFYLTYLDAYMHSDTHLLLPPAIAVWIKNNSEDNESLRNFLQLLDLPRRNIIICPVIGEDNNLKIVARKRKSRTEDGRHWSLLVFVRSQNAFMHYDSSKENTNRSDAEKVYKMLRPYVTMSVSESNFATYIEFPNTPKQEQPWDCGVYILAFARIICGWYNKNGPDNVTDDRLWFPEIEDIKPSYISSMRSQIMEMFKTLLNGKAPRVYTKNYKEANMTLCRALIKDMKQQILKEDVVLTYNGVDVRLDDFDSLEEPFFITDRVIEFYFSYLSSSINSDEILLVPPSVIFWLRDGPHDEESLRNFPDPLLPLNPSKRKIVILPLINETKEIIAANGGNHWSLLAFERSANVFVHHDSSEENLNATIAQGMYEAVRPYVSTSSSESDATTYMEYPKTPKQEDPSDCGMYVLAIAKAICTWYTSRSGSSGSGSSSSATKSTDEEFWFPDVERITLSLISSLRPDVQELIVDLGEKQQ